MVDTTRYNTGNGLGSNKLEDLSDNAKNIDNFANSGNETFTDRFGVSRKSIAGMESDHVDQINAHEIEHDNQIARHESEFITHIEGMGWTPAAGSFQAGGTITDRNQTLYDEVSQVFYAWGGTLPKVVPVGSTPSTAGGTGIGAWSDKTDLMLRSDINIVQKRFACVDDMVTDTSLLAGQIVEFVSYVLGKSIGGNKGIITSSGTPDGGRYISLSNGLLFKSLTYALTPTQFGAIPDYGSDNTDNHVALNNWAKQNVCRGEEGKFYSSTAVTFTGTNPWVKDCQGLEVYFGGTDILGFTSSIDSTGTLQIDKGLKSVFVGSATTTSNGFDFSGFRKLFVDGVWSQGWKNSGIKIANVRNYEVVNGVFWLNDWDGTTPFATGADILVYSSTAGESKAGKILDNWCLSDASQGILVNSLSYDRDIIIRGNHVAVYDSTFSPKDTSLVKKRHCIEIGYNSDQTYGGNLIVEGNILRSAKWTGIYRSGNGNAEFPGATILNNRIYSVGFGTDSGGVLGGILLGNVVSGDAIEGNIVDGFGGGGANQSAAFRLQDSVGVCTSVRFVNNQDINSLGYGVYLTGNVNNVDIINHKSVNPYLDNICLEAISSSTLFGDINIKGSVTIRNTIGYGISSKANLNGLNVIEENVIKGSDVSLTDNASVGIYITRGIDTLSVRKNIIKAFKWGTWYNTSSTAVTTTMWGDNTFVSCLYGGMFQGSASANYVYVNPNRYVNTPNRFGTNGGYAVASEQFMINGVAAS